MKVLKITSIDNFPIENSNVGVWQPINNTVSGEYWIKLEAEQDLIKNNISYEVGDVEIKIEEINTEKQ